MSTPEIQILQIELGAVKSVSNSAARPELKLAAADREASLTKEIAKLMRAEMAKSAPTEVAA